MARRRVLWQSLLLCLAGCATVAPTPVDIYGPINCHRWAVYYDKTLPAEHFSGMDLVVFDRVHHPHFATLKNKTILLAYISAGEVAGDATDYADLEKDNILLSRNHLWKSHVVDIASPVWQKRLLAEVDDAAEKGFDGVMLDTFDSPLAWARTSDPKHLNLMLKAGAELVEAIRSRHPNMKIMVNRGNELLPLIGTRIDYILAESIRVKTDVSSGHFALFSPNTYNQAAAQLHRMVALAPHLQVFTLDYWDQDDVDGLQRIYATQRAQGFAPYVTTPDLRRLTPEPYTSNR